MLKKLTKIPDKFLKFRKNSLPHSIEKSRNFEKNSSIQVIRGWHRLNFHFQCRWKNEINITAEFFSKVVETIQNTFKMNLNIIKYNLDALERVVQHLNFH